MGNYRTLSNARRFTLVLAATLSLGAVGVGGYNLAGAQSVSDERPVFIPINPCRLVDTRAGASNTGPLARPLGSETVSITAHGSNGECVGASAIPTSALGLSMNVTAIRATEPGTFLTFWGSGPNPGSSNLNPAPGQPPTPNSVNTPLSDTGTFNMANALGTVEVLIDVNGYYADHDHDDRYLQLDALDGYSTTQEVDDRFLTVSELNAGYAQLDALPFLAGGVVTDDETQLPQVTSFNGPSGVTPSVVGAGVGLYTVTLTNTGGLTDPIIQITGIADPTPMGTSMTSTGATACSLSDAPPSTVANNLVFDVGCFGEDDDNAGAIVAEDVSFSFIVVS